ncbi:hypothetical protein NKJ36_07535 [Mesorhizobium sp. M0142]|uniref:hypothetical protein n=1 Tax=Mesorhizobium sp. M0142 TaxID=2956894 RepID=UPI003339C1A3
MAHDLQKIVDSLWQSTDQQAAARKARLTLDATDRDRLGEIAQTLRERSIRQRSDRSGGHESQPIRQGSVDIEGLLVLLTFAVHHSDTLAYLPTEEREGRLREWAEITGYSVDEVRQACTLGAFGLAPLLHTP